MLDRVSQVYYKGMGKHHVIYVPGLGDHRTYGQNIAIQLWRLFGLTPHYLPLGWADKQPFQPKLMRLIRKIDALKTDKNYVSLCGVSAGASATLNAYGLTNKISGVVWLAGKINNPQTVRSSIYLDNPAFEQSMAAVVTSLSKLDKNKLRRILSIHALEDNSVPPADSKVEGTIEKTIHSKGHAFSIFYGVFTCGRSISKFLRLQEV